MRDNVRMSTHYDGCWRHHHECAVARVERLEKALETAKWQATNMLFDATTEWIEENKRLQGELAAARQWSAAWKQAAKEWRGVYRQLLQVAHDAADVIFENHKQLAAARGSLYRARLAHKERRRLWKRERIFTQYLLLKFIDKAKWAAAWKRAAKRWRTYCNDANDRVEELEEELADHQRIAGVTGRKFRDLQAELAAQKRTIEQLQHYLAIANAQDHDNRVIIGQLVGLLAVLNTLSPDKEWTTQKLAALGLTWADAEAGDDNP